MHDLILFSSNLSDGGLETDARVLCNEASWGQPAEDIGDCFSLQSAKLRTRGLPSWHRRSG